MSPLKKVVLSVIRLVAAAGIFLGVLFVSIEVAKAMVSKEPVDKLAVTVRCLPWSLPTIAGIVLLFKASALASRLTQDYDD